MTNIEFSYKSNFCGTTMGGEARKLVRFKALAKDFYVGEFMGDQWAVLKRPATEVLGTRTDLSVVGCVDRVDDRDLNVEGLQETIAGLRKENDNLVMAMGKYQNAVILGVLAEKVNKVANQDVVILNEANRYDVPIEQMRVDDFPLLGGML
ncbi:hypothetical protein LguiB_032634 [Lonicera macranthoides]